MRKYATRFSSLFNTNNWGVACLSQRPDFAPTILNLIYVEIRVTTEWLPTSHVLELCALVLRGSRVARKGDSG
jgi:hypothetical protein